jgi:hypothetical protein
MTSHDTVSGPHRPEGLRSWVMKMLRVSIRLNAYLALLTDEYPPFSTD